MCILFLRQPFDLLNADFENGGESIRREPVVVEFAPSMKGRSLHKPRAGAPVDAVVDGNAKRRHAVWYPSTRFAFRFAFAFLGLYSVVSHILVFMFVLPNILPGQGLGALAPMFDVTSWVA